MPWLALLFLRAFFFRAFFAMLCLLVLVTSGRGERGGGRVPVPGTDPLMLVRMAAPGVRWGRAGVPPALRPKVTAVMIGYRSQEHRWRGRAVSMAEEIRAEMVANVWKVVASAGDSVSEGDTLVILESMKMEIPVVAESDGVVQQIAVNEGDVVQDGDLIAVIG
ncbi:Biotin-requiring enzyme [Micromonospora viridifaciens]|nr:Biotin-requiring enzyme [Micromonospora viridifaciens]